MSVIEKQKLAVEKLRWECDENLFPFETGGSGKVGMLLQK